MSRDNTSRDNQSSTSYDNETVVIQELTRTLRDIINLQEETNRNHNDCIGNIINMLSRTMESFYTLRHSVVSQSSSSRRERSRNRNTLPQTSSIFSTPVLNGNRQLGRRNWQVSRNRDNNTRRQDLLNRTLNPTSSRSVPRINFSNRIIGRNNNSTQAPLLNAQTTNNFFENFLNSTLHSTQYPRFTLTREEIDRSVTTETWSDISETTDQSICPINQTRFSDTDIVCRLTNCGHIFSTAAINNYLLNYDNRCPVCRQNVLINNNNENTTNNLSPSNSENNNTTDTVGTNTTETVTTNTNVTSNLISDEAINNISNTLVNEITNNLFPNNTNTTSTPSQINAEYSFFFPTRRTQVTSSNSTENIGNSADRQNVSNERTFYWNTQQNGSRAWSTHNENSDPVRYVTTYETITNNNSQEISRDNRINTDEVGETKEEEALSNETNGEINTESEEKIEDEELINSQSQHK